MSLIGPHDQAPDDDPPPNVDEPEWCPRCGREERPSEGCVGCGDEPEIGA